MPTNDGEQEAQVMVRDLSRDGDALGECEEDDEPAQQQAKR